MGLITKTVIMRWYYKTKDWYESKGYIFTNFGDEFEVKVEDLTNGTHVLVDVKCDCEDCTTPINKPVIWSNYIRSITKYGKYYCKRCAKKLFGGENTRKTKLKNGKSLGYWLIKNLPLREAVNIIARWDEEKNGKDIRDISYSSNGINNKGYWFKCGKSIHSSELHNIANFTQGHKGSLDCNACNSIGQYLIDLYGKDALEKYWDYEKNNALGLDTFKINKSSIKKVWIFCQIHNYHGSYLVSCNDFTSKDQRCPYCHGFKIHKYDSLGYLYPQVIPIWSEKNKKTPYDYMPMSNIKVYWKCLDGKHKDYYRDINSSNNADFRCPECVQERDESIIQEKTRLYLESLNYNILHEHNCIIIPINPKTKYPLPFDNEINLINNKKIIIEVNGKQHYEELDKNSNWLNGLTPKEYLHKRKLYDRYKKLIAYKNGYEYLELPYWVFDKQDTYKKLIANKINHILNRKVGD